MKHCELLGKQLKDPLVIDVLECGDLDVIYGFDRLYENQPDEYWVSAQDDGIQMHFDEHQVLDTLYFHIEPEDDFSSCDQGSMGLPVFGSRESAKAFAESSALPFQQGELDFLGIFREWIKIDFGTHLHHSEFRGATLHQVTAMLPTKAEQDADDQAAAAVE
jgi:hypothetical protein